MRGQFLVIKNKGLDSGLRTFICYRLGGNVQKIKDRSFSALAYFSS